MRTLVIMQPYLFPYLGYFQMLQAADRFVLYDDVNFIKRGWIHRNRLSINGKEFLFSVPLNKPSQNKLICETFIADDSKWQDKLTQTIRIGYSKAPYFNDFFPVLEGLVRNSEKDLTAYIEESFKRIASYLSIDTEIVRSSDEHPDTADLKGQERIMAICKKEKAERYINPVGGMTLYQPEYFQQNQVELYFHKMGNVKYLQGKGDFIPYLSIIDVLMYNGREAVHDFLTNFELITKE